MNYRTALITFALAPFWAHTASAQASAKSTVELSADSLLRAGNAAAALRGYQKLLASDSAQVRYWNGVGNAAAALHENSLAANAFEHAAAGGKMLTAMYNAGALHARMGHTELALDWLDKAVTAGFLVPSLFATDSDLVSLRDNPRFQSIAQRAAVVPAPCMSDSNARRFDFWVGVWDVTPAQSNSVVGHSLVQRVSGGCALLENWTAGNGSEGKSLNTYNPAVGQWQQYWVGQQGGPTEYRESHWNGSTLVLLAHSTGPQGPYDQRLSFTPIDASTVRQFGETSTDGGRTWSVGYDFHYHRKK